MVITEDIWYLRVMALFPTEPAPITTSFKVIIMMLNDENLRERVFLLFLFLFCLQDRQAVQVEMGGGIE